MRELFVYYRVNAALADAARAEVLRMQAELCARHDGLQARLLRRPCESDGLQTWMETYTLEGQPDGVSKAVQSEIEHAAEPLAPWIDGQRHSEVFDPL